MVYALSDVGIPCNELKGDRVLVETSSVGKKPITATRFNDSMMTFANIYNTLFSQPLMPQRPEVTRFGSIEQALDDFSGSMDPVYVVQHGMAKHVMYQH
ncbi:MAG: hypothetical protein HGA85_00075 [Nanoarchaeota archaeon]|nr:hypothetical protein [Nanoarchaeota archaeon]